MSKKISIDTIGNRIHNLPDCSTVPRTCVQGLCIFEIHWTNSISQQSCTFSCKQSLFYFGNSVISKPSCGCHFLFISVAWLVWAVHISKKQTKSWGRLPLIIIIIIIIIIIVIFYCSFITLLCDVSTKGWMCLQGWQINEYAAVTQ